jgi:hypothetical protein
MCADAAVVQDVMQVCRNGHVTTDLLRTNPDSSLTHCDRCGATTIDRCPTCGLELPGAFTVPTRPVGSRQAPLYCSNCGNAFPWTKCCDRTPRSDALTRLAGLLERLPRTIRQLRVRHGDRPAFCVADIRDLEDLVRAILPLHFDDIRPESRAPGYSPVTRTDFLLAPERIALTLKYAAPELGTKELGRQLAEDAAYYERLDNYRTLACYIYDPEGRLRHSAIRELASSACETGIDVVCLLGEP